MQKFKVAGIVPCYNHEKWVLDAIYSLANQTYKPYEIIVIDDNSTDDSYNKIKSLIYKPKIHNKPDKITGILKSSGGIPLFIGQHREGLAGDRGGIVRRRGTDPPGQAIPRRYQGQRPGQSREHQPGCPWRDDGSHRVD